MPPLKKKMEVAQRNTTIQRNTIVQQNTTPRRKLLGKMGSPATTNVSTLLGMLEILCTTIEDVDKVHQEPHKLIIDLNVVPYEDNMDVETLPTRTQALLLVLNENCFVHEADKP